MDSYFYITFATNVSFVDCYELYKMLLTLMNILFTISNIQSEIKGFYKLGTV